MGATKRNAVVFATDRALFPVAVFQATHVASLGLPPDTEIVVATESADDVRLAIDSGAPFRPLLLDPGSIAGLQMRAGVYQSPATYYRLFLPRLLGKDYRRLLYLDVDVHIHSNRLFGLFGIGMNGHAIGAVRDLLPFRENEKDQRELRNTTTNIERKYLNAGVLLIDPTEFAEQELEARVLAATRQRELYLQDQSALNIVLDGDWLELSLSFNMFVELWGSYVPQVCEPVVVHFIGSRKPWHGPRFTAAHPAKGHIERYFRDSPWPDFLARFYGFEDAWRQLQHGRPPQPKPPGRVAFASAFIFHLYSTRFADVDEGITTLRFDAMPCPRPIPLTKRPAPPPDPSAPSA
jgi:lipopolysaccharide biosynthesis glycosyltransferase